MDQKSREQLLNLLAINSFRLGEFTLSSGIKSDYYIDCRTTTLHAQGAELSGRVFLDLFRGQGWSPVAVGGLTLGADPIVVAVAVISSQCGSPVHGFLVRKAEKAHGMGRRIEGFQEKGAKVIIVDDSTLILGSFNFSSSAQHSNDENMLVSRNDPQLVAAYEAEYARMQQLSA